MLKKNNNLVSFNFRYHRKPPYQRCARLHLRRSRQNIFFTVTDLTNRVVSSLSLGQVALSRNKRIKRSPATLERLFLRVR